MQTGTNKDRATRGETALHKDTLGNSSEAHTDGGSTNNKQCAKQYEGKDIRSTQDGTRGRSQPSIFKLKHPNTNTTNRGPTENSKAIQGNTIKYTIWRNAPCCPRRERRLGSTAPRCTQARHTPDTPRGWSVAHGTAAIERNRGQWRVGRREREREGRRERWKGKKTESERGKESKANNAIGE